MKDIVSKDIAHQRGLRISKISAEALMNLYGSHTQNDHLHAEDLFRVNYAHVVMLYEQSLLTVEEAKRILQSMRKLEVTGWDKMIKLDPRVGDLTTHVESYIIKDTGEDIGGKIHTGRSRNDLVPTLDKMLIRSSILNAYNALLTLEGSLLVLTSAHRETILPGYTHHSQHAQPITLGHFLLGNFDVFYRNLERVEDFWPRLNTCPMGAAALATTGFPLDRNRMAALLGFDGIHEHSYDAISAKDFVLEYLFILSTIASDLGRIAENLLLWNTFEFGMIVMADEYTSFSTIMPQKKNPVGIETIRVLNSGISGKLFNAFGMLKAESWCNGRETTILLDDSVDTGKQVRDLILLLDGILNSMEVKKERMYEMARRGFSTATELADTLVRECHLPFRTAHEIVGLVVKRAVDSGLDSTQITGKMVEESMNEYLAREIRIDEDSIQKALDPRRNVELRKLPGGPAFEEVTRMMNHRAILLDEKGKVLSGFQSQLTKAYQVLRQRVDEILQQ